MSLNKFRVFFVMGVLLFFSNFSQANSTHNIYMMTLSILSYAKWNDPTPTLCVTENQNAAKQFLFYLKQQNSPFSVKNISYDEIKIENCDAIYFSNTSPSVEQKLLNSTAKQSVLSFSSNNHACEIGSVFCLQSTKNGNTIFKVNLDSLARSKVHVDPRVLLLAKNSE
ncbi:YfiR family protein [Acinetobacter sp. Marseille-Q1618]|uniref:YfiR family protein n=1 Tax=Acinetobacter sp. Marseille-Q1618 TaxID=2697502 RepID=UPI00156DF13F|nr:YfiR family protein [Acinetobacter sp. Marseille-Q1618]